MNSTVAFLGAFYVGTILLAWHVLRWSDRP